MWFLLLIKIQRLRNWQITGSALFRTTTLIIFNMQTLLSSFKMLGISWWGTWHSNHLLNRTSNYCCILSINNFIFLFFAKSLKKFRNSRTKTFFLICKTFFYFMILNFCLHVWYLEFCFRCSAYFQRLSFNILKILNGL